MTPSHYRTTGHFQGLSGVFQLVSVCHSYPMSRTDVPILPLLTSLPVIINFINADGVNILQSIRKKFWIFIFSNFICYNTETTFSHKYLLIKKCGTF